MCRLFALFWIFLFMKKGEGDVVKKIFHCKKKSDDSPLSPSSNNIFMSSSVYSLHLSLSLTMNLECSVPSVSHIAYRLQ